jgi:hypothetical protein
MPAPSVTDTIKTWLHPGLMYILSTIIFYQVSQTQSDVKTLLAQSNVDKTEIAHLKEEVAELKQVVFFSKHASLIKPSSVTNSYCSVDQYFKHEEEFDIKKFVPRVI